MRIKKRLMLMACMAFFAMSLSAAEGDSTKIQNPMLWADVPDPDVMRKETQTPFVFMTYANVVFSYGAEKFISLCKETGVDGIILPDLPFEEKEEFSPICDKYDVDLISLIAPTSENRISMIAKEAKGFIYIVSSLGVTGTRSEIKTDLDSIVKVIRENTDVPCAIGFGISTPEQAAKMSAISDGAIVGSAIIKILEKYGKDAPKYVGEYVHSMKSAM